MVDQKAHPDAEEEEHETWKTFLFNPHKGTVLGRNAYSWFHLTVFYCAYYSLIAVLSYWTITTYMKYMVVPTADGDARPRHQTRVSSPGLATFQPTKL